MACLITLAGITLDCQPSLGGIKRVWLTPYANLNGEVTVDTIDNSTEEEKDTTYGMITDIPLVEGAEWYSYQFRKATGSMNSTLNVDETAGINYVTTELSLVFTRMETPKRMEIAALSIGQLCAIVEDSNGHYWFLGKDDYVSASAGAGNTGTAKGDQNAYTLTLSTDSDSYPYEIDPTYVQTILGA